MLIRTIVLTAIAAAPLSAQPRWQLSPQPRLTLGGDNDPATEFTRVVAAFRLPTGTIVVANGATRELRVFGPDGKFRRKMGRDGAGPGEFKLISWAGHVGDTLVVADGINRRVRAQQVPVPGRLGEVWRMTERASVLGEPLPKAELSTAEGGTRSAA